MAIKFSKKNKWKSECICGNATDGPNPEPSSRLHSGGNLVARKKFEFLNSPTPSKAPTSSNATEPPVRPPRRHNSPKSSKQITDQVGGNLSF